MHIIIIPEQIVENPNFKPILVVKEWPTFYGFWAKPNILACLVYNHYSRNQNIDKRLFVDKTSLNKIYIMLSKITIRVLRQ